MCANAEDEGTEKMKGFLSSPENFLVAKIFFLNGNYSNTLCSVLTIDY